MFSYGFNDISKIITKMISVHYITFFLLRKSLSLNQLRSQKIETRNLGSRNPEFLEFEIRNLEIRNFGSRKKSKFWIWDFEKISDFDFLRFRIFGRLPKISDFETSEFRISKLPRFRISTSEISDFRDFRFRLPKISEISRFRISTSEISDFDFRDFGFRLRDFEIYIQ